MKKRGVKVGVVKHTPHGFDVGKNDTGRFYKAGADFVVASSGKELLKIERSKKERSLFEILKEFQEFEIVLVEGFKSAHIPWIVVFDNEITRYDITLLQEREIIGLVIQGLSQIGDYRKTLRRRCNKKKWRGRYKNYSRR